MFVWLVGGLGSVCVACCGRFRIVSVWHSVKFRGFGQCVSEFA